MLNLYNTKEFSFAYLDFLKVMGCFVFFPENHKGFLPDV